MPIDNKLHVQTSNESKPVSYQYGDMVYYKDGTLKTVDSNENLITIAKKSEVDVLETDITNKLAKKADLDENGLVPSSQLPSYVDDVILNVLHKKFYHL